MLVSYMCLKYWLWIVNCIILPLLIIIFLMISQARELFLLQKEQTGSGAHTAPFLNAYWIPFLQESDGWVTWLLCLVLRLIMCEVILPSAFMFCTGTKNKLLYNVQSYWIEEHGNYSALFWLPRAAINH